MMAGRQDDGRPGQERVVHFSEQSPHSNLSTRESVREQYINPRRNLCRRTSDGTCSVEDRRESSCGNVWSIPHFLLNTWRKEEEDIEYCERNRTWREGREGELCHRQLVSQEGKWQKVKMGCRSPLLITRLVMLTLLVIITVFLSVGTFYITKNNYNNAIGGISDRLREEVVAKVQIKVETLLKRTQTTAIGMQHTLKTVLGSRKNFTVAELLSEVRALLWGVFQPLQDEVSALIYVQLDGTSVAFQRSQQQGPFCIFANVSGDLLTTPEKPYGQQVDRLTGAPISPVAELPFVLSADTLGGPQSILALLKSPTSSTSWRLSFAIGEAQLYAYLVVRAKNGQPAGLLIMTNTVVHISSFMEEVKLPGSKIFVGSNDGFLVASSSDETQDSPSGRVTRFTNATSASDPTIADSATLLQARFGFANLTLAAYNLSNVKVAGERSYINSVPVRIDNLRLYVVITRTRESVLGSVDSKGHTTLIILAVVSCCVLLIGTIIIVFLTLYVSMNMTPAEELRKQKEETQRAQAASEVKSQFLANISHDLRTPMAGILGLLDIMLCDRLTSEQGANLRQMKSCAASLLGLLNNLLDLAKVEAGKLQLECLEFDLVGELESLVDLFSVQSLSLKTELALDLSDDFERTVKGDPSKVRQVFANLLSNACKFTKEGHVLIRGWTKNKPVANGSSWASASPKNHLGNSVPEEAREAVTLVFEIDDTGPGIPPNKRNLIFEKFQQADITTSRTHGGTGLGLGIVRALVRLMGGEIAVVDKEGPGTCFRFELVFDKVGDSSHWKNALVAPSFLMPKLRTTERGQVLLAMVENSAGASIAGSWMERRGLQVWRVTEWPEVLPSVLNMLRHRQASRFHGGVIPLSAPLGLQEWPPPNRGITRIFGRSISGSNVPHSGPMAFRGSESRWRRPERSGSPSLSEPEDSDREGEGLGLALALIDICLIPDMMRFLADDLNLFRARMQLQGVVVAWLVEHNTPAETRRILRRSGGAVVTKPLYSSRMAPLLALATARRGSERQLSTNGSDSERDSHTPDQSVRAAVAAAISLKPPVIPHSLVVEFPDAVDDDEDQEQLLWDMEQHQADGSSDSPVDFSVDLQQLSMLEQPSPVGFGPRMTPAGHVATPEPGVGFETGDDEDEIDNFPDVPYPRIPLERLPVQEPTAEPAPKHLHRPPTKDGFVKAREEKGQVPALSGIHVLIAEDTVLLKKVAVIRMRQLGCTVEAVSDGQEAVDAVLATYKALEESRDSPKPFDAVLMDCQMPKMDGYSATAAIRAAESSSGHHLPIIALTAHAMTSDERKCLDAGMDAYLTKPIDAELMTSTILALVRPGSSGES